MYNDNKVIGVVVFFRCSESGFSASPQSAWLSHLDIYGILLLVVIRTQIFFLEQMKLYQDTGYQRYGRADNAIIGTTHKVGTNLHPVSGWPKKFF